MTIALRQNTPPNSHTFRQKMKPCDKDSFSKMCRLTSFSILYLALIYTACSTTITLTNLLIRIDRRIKRSVLGIKNIDTIT